MEGGRTQSGLLWELSPSRLPWMCRIGIGSAGGLLKPINGEPPTGAIDASRPASRDAASSYSIMAPFENPVA